MISYLFYGGTLIIPLIYLFKRGKQIELFNIFLILFILFYGPAFFFFNTDIDEASTIVAFCLGLTIIGIFLGKLLLNYIILRYRDIQKLKDIPITKMKINIRFTPLIILFVFILVMFSLALFKYGGITNIMIVLRSGGSLSPMDLKELRFDFKIQGWVGGIIGYLESIGIFISLLMFSYSFEKKKKLLLRLNFLLCALILLWGISTLHKAIAFFYLLQIFIYFYLIRQKKWVWNTSIIIKATLFILLLIIPIYLLLTNSEGIGEALEEALFRITGEPNRVLKEYFIWWPKHFPHRLGLNIRIIHSIFGSGEFEPAYKTLVYQYAELDSIFLGTWPTIFIADAWVDFSYFGVIFFSIVVGFLLSLIDIKLRAYHNSIGAALFATMVGALFNLVENSLLTVLLTGGLGTIPILFKLLVKRKTYKVNIER